MDLKGLSVEIEQYIGEEPRFFSDILRKFINQPYRDILLAWSIIREKDVLKRDEEGHYLIYGENFIQI
ncbi:MAG TPA: hypothetical protein VN456_16340 [Desulfosporosinus sp.]|nr:hypothetical protein [Desulfosporosinus sp.]